ncbi:MAG: response regulator transcription factor [Sulfurospirillum sp.]|nr:response regulator transcription factor [Sulfurospirillum sp.]
MKILLLEDDIILNEIITEFLQEHALEVHTFYDGESAIEAVYEKSYDILLLDINVPKLNGFELLKELNTLGKKIPTIFITSLNDINDVKKGFALGAEDYLKKPFELEELWVRIKRTQELHGIESSEGVLLADDLLYFPKSYEILSKEKKITIRKKDAQILEYFMKHKNMVISFEKLLADIWEYDNEPSRATVRTYIKNLRIILGKDLFENIKGVGYRFKCL